MRKQLEVDIKGCMNQDLASAMKDLLEKHNALVAEYDSLVALLEANKADISAVDFASESSSSSVSID